MPRFSANLSFLFGELATMPERIEAAAECGFSAVEYMFPYAEDVGALRDQLKRHNVQQVLFNLPAGDFAGGERGIALDPRRVGEFRSGVADAVRIAGELNCTRINCLVGKILPDVDSQTMRATLVENLCFAAQAFASEGLTLLIEPLNRIETPGFAIGTSTEGLELITEVGHKNVKLQYDCYHAQRAEGNLIATLQTRLGSIGHVQIADSPARNQPGTGELAYERILRSLDAFGYADWVGLEYKPLTTTRESFAWIEAFGFERKTAAAR